MVPPQQDDSEFKALVSAALELRDQGIQPDLDVICSVRPDLREAVADAIGASERLALLQRRSATYDQFKGRLLLGRYELGDRLGAGAMGVVYRAQDIDLSRPVAVKVLRAALLGGEEAEVRFSREAEVMAAIDHPAVVTIHDRGRTEEDDPFLVMELLEGASLSQVLEAGKLKGVAAQGQDTRWIQDLIGGEGLEEQSYLRLVVRWCADLASGLAAAHEKGIFHRDVKPSNIFLRPDGRPVLLDFGIAARVSHATLTREGSPLGTPAYMAPESLQPNHTPGAGLDVYGLTATLYHLLTLRPPYSGSPSQIITTLFLKEPTPAAQLREGLPRDLQAILDRGMARKPAERYACAADLEADLRAFLDYRPVQARRISPWARTWRRLRRSPAFRAGAAVALLGLAGLAAVQLRSDWLEGRAAEHQVLWRHLPPNLGINPNAESRLLTSALGRQEIGQRLDAAAELYDHPLPTLLVRAGFRLDHGDPAGAAQDMRRVADALGSDLTRVLADRYARLPTDAMGGADLDLASLPLPRADLDEYVLAFHLMRTGQHGEALALLEDPSLEEFLPAQQLLLPLLTRDPHRMYELAVSVEERYGVRTATTAGWLGIALLLQRRYDRAYSVLSEARELSPQSFFLENNLGVAAWRMDELQLARAHFERAIELDPTQLKAHEDLVKVLIHMYELEQAATVARSAVFGSEPEARCKQLVLLGTIETEAALVAEEPAEAVAAAKRAVEFFDEVTALGGKVDSAHASISEALLQAAADAEVNLEHDPVFAGLLEVLEKDPVNRRRLLLLSDWMPETLNMDQAAGVQALLRVIAEELEGLGPSTGK